MVAKMMVTAKLPESVHQTLLEKIIKDGYGMRGKSRWVQEALEQFLSLNNYPELVDIATEMNEMTSVISIRVAPMLLQNLDKAIIAVRKIYPGMEGVKSCLIRASIIQRLIRG